ncbi:MAG TPA: type II secretion system protein, partial [Actinomycetota bacterium]|nr:type II secretion system protein [Actinomycetota bacterium]
MTLTIDALYALLAGGLASGGLLLLVVALRGLPRRAPANPNEWGLERLRRFLTQRVTISVVAALVTLVVTRWPIAALGAGLL